MPNNVAALVLSVVFVSVACADDMLQLTNISLRPAPPVVLFVGYSGSLPPAATSYNLSSDWKAEWQSSQKGPPTIVSVDHVEVDTANKIFALHVSGNLPQVSDMRTLFWTVLFVSDQVPFTTVTFSPTPKTAAKSCTDTTTSKPYLCPPGPTDTPDLSFTGSFTAAGGTNPLYQFEVKSGVILPRIPKIPFDPALNMQVEINQNATPPIHRTRFDPDSITAGFALTNVINKNFGPLEGFRFQAQLPEGEFSRNDPSSNIIAAGLATLDFKPVQPQGTSLYFTLRPFLGVEAGRNLNRPRAVQGIPVDLSHYRAIVRGYTGADVKFAIASADRKSDTFSITGTYRARIPAFDEPFLETLHQVTTFALTTKVRHWVESDVSYTITTWKYLSVTATYQYGELPPFFSFVDHKVAIGLKVQAVQTTKPHGTGLVH